MYTHDKVTHEMYGVDEQTWKDFLIIRKAKKAPLTKTALKRMVTQAEKAKITLQEAMAICCERGWQAFKAEWVKNEPKQPKFKDYTTVPDKEINYEPMPKETRKVIDKLMGKMEM